ncbi:hypothetical protein BO79DRAFT_51149 [Aspergillus costaricaensis CBS 115574]|uniref:Uncharacterized protein n=1 Tax=Aspergillus costaricaensis CBS 115574 TaxID=1448317 RepID=A0ACD1I4T8_9EURO|nr:hypothetical protein BO79DRAFT_51149 [Aspergillus costaricaensis CBS 115574]RAK84773.1 hypothetical protein BO79DRAFT_51149 [Aspergillus costaricaensis CBS 115574]
MKNAAVAIGFPVGVIPALQTRDPSQKSGFHGGFGSIDRPAADTCLYHLYSAICNPPLSLPPYIPSLSAAKQTTPDGLTVPPLTLSCDPLNPYTAFEMGLLPAHGTGGDANGEDE